MTCIVGVADKGRVVIGGDSAGVAGYDLSIRGDEKVFRNGPYLMGFAGSFRMGQLLHHAFEPPYPPDAKRLDKFMVTDFIDGVRGCLEAGGWLRTKHERERGGFFLVGVRGQLFRIESDFQVGRDVNGYVALGCGDNLALGSLHATADMQDVDARDRVRWALEAAAFHSAGVAAPFVILDVTS